MTVYIIEKTRKEMCLCQEKASLIKIVKKDQIVQNQQSININIHHTAQNMCGQILLKADGILNLSE